MSCYSPLRAVVLGYKPDGKKILKVLPNSDYLNSAEGYDYIELPCGHCIGCRLRYSRTWADRCIAESMYHDSNLFLTLTYNDDHLPDPLPLDLDPVTGECEVSPIHPLVKRDVQLFIKRLRKKFPEQKIRYFLCGEYGSKNMRPHYHLILFGLKLDDLELLYKNDDSFTYYTSKVIEELWYVESDPFNSAGFHIITSVNWNTCAYVARYIVKKQFGQNADIYEKLGYPKEFTLMSRKPGIGYDYFCDHMHDLYSDIHASYVATEDGAREILPNRYYDRLYDLEFPSAYAVIADKRKQRMMIRDSIKDNLTDKFFLDRLKAAEDNQLARIKSLERSDL